MSLQTGCTVSFALCGNRPLQQNMLCYALSSAFYTFLVIGGTDFTLEAKGPDLNSTD